MSRLDAGSGYYQTPDDNSQPPTTLFGHYWHNHVPFGLISSGNVFQLCMLKFLDRLDGVECHMNDLLAYSSENKDEQSDTVRKMLKRLKV